MKHDYLLLATVVIIILLITICTPVIAATTTNTPLNIQNYTVDLNGTAGVTGDCNFRISRVASIFPYNTSFQPVAIAGFFQHHQNGFPLMPGDTYYYQACCEDGCGVTVSFTLNRSATLTQTTYTAQYYDPFIEADWNFTALSGIMQSAYGSLLGSVPLFIGSVWGLFLAMMWIRSENIIPPLFVSLILSTTLYYDPMFTPAAWKPILMMMTVVAVAGLLYTFFKGR